MIRISILKATDLGMQMKHLSWGPSPHITTVTSGCYVPPCMLKGV